MRWSCRRHGPYFAHGARARTGRHVRARGVEGQLRYRCMATRSNATCRTKLRQGPHQKRCMRSSSRRPHGSGPSSSCEISRVASRQLRIEPTSMPAYAKGASRQTRLVVRRPVRLHCGPRHPAFVDAGAPLPCLHRGEREPDPAGRLATARGRGTPPTPGAPLAWVRMDGHSAASRHALHRRDLQHPQGILPTQPADGDPRAARAAAGLDADILFLQEVLGVHERHAARHRDWPAKPQHEFIADTNWREVAYGRTAINRYGHQGNAVLSRYPIATHENLDISAHPFESRGLLHCEIRLGARGPTLHCINVHLGLFERGRQWQIQALCERIRETVPMDAPLVIAGDFNDWRHKANRALVEELGVHEVFEAVRGRPARTFPSVHAGVSPRSHLRARARDPRRARALRLSLRPPDVRPRGARGDVRHRPASAMNAVRPRQPRRPPAQRRRVLPGAGRRDRPRGARGLARNLHLRRRRRGPHRRGRARARVARAASRCA